MSNQSTNSPVLTALVNNAVLIAKELILDKLNRNKDRNKYLKNAAKFDEFLRGYGIVFRVVDFEALTNLWSHREFVRDWSETIYFRQSKGEKYIEQVFIDLDIYITPRSIHTSENEKKYKYPLIQKVQDVHAHCVILGLPGAGKTTSMKKLCGEILRGRSRLPQRFPILIRLREFLGDYNLNKLQNVICNILGVEFFFDEKGKQKFLDGVEVNWRCDVFFKILDAINPLIILDGFDELPSETEKKYLINEIAVFNERLQRTKIIITCRTGEFDFSLKNTSVFEIASLTATQIKQFSKNWLKDEEKTQKFISDVLNSPFSDTAMKPLSLAHLCAIYEKNGSIPEQSNTIYRLVINLMLREWDQQRRIVRPTKYAQFPVEKKELFLSKMAYILSVKFNITVFNTSRLEQVYSVLYRSFGLEEHEQHKVIKELESHTGLFIQTGIDKYEFVHKSLQEFLTADYIVKLPSMNPLHNICNRLASELAIAVCISSEPGEYLSRLVHDVFVTELLPENFYFTFMQRLFAEFPHFENCIISAISILTVASQAPLHPTSIKLLMLDGIKDALSGVFEFYDLAFEYEKPEDSISGRETDETEDTIKSYVLKKIKEFEGYDLVAELSFPAGEISLLLVSERTNFKPRANGALMLD